MTKRTREYDAKMKIWQANHRHANWVRMMDHLAANPCTDCGIADPVVLEFDHLPEFEKKYDVSRAVSSSTRSWASISTEIAKCEVVCANCHRRRTLRRSGARKHVMYFGELADEVA